MHGYVGLDGDFSTQHASRNACTHTSRHELGAACLMISHKVTVEVAQKWVTRVYVLQVQSW